MHVLVIGSGGREHALCWAIAKSPLCGRLSAVPGNGGIAEIATCLLLDPLDFAGITAFCRAENVGLVVVGPDAPLAEGIVDHLEAAGIKAFGPTAGAARLESSKGFTKDLCTDAGIPTARYQRFASAAAAMAYVKDHPLPVVIKADGLALGKGVIIATTRAEAEAAVSIMFAGEFGAAGHTVVIEEFLEGEEASFFVLSDGETALPLASAQDHKRAFDGDTGPNTGGMGAYSPAPVMTEAVTAQVMRAIITPTLDAMRAMGCPFKGVLYAGLMITATGPKLIEYNARFGDPEAQVLMLRLKSDLLPALIAAREGRLKEIALSWSEETAISVVMASRGYPGRYQKGSVIKGLDKAATLPNVTVFHAGTQRRSDGAVTANGGRVLNICATGSGIAEARGRAYDAVRLIDWPEGFCRNDIGWRALVRLEPKA
ncbi:MAG: phosphoribosylamine--glycine ligase [Alphaproteobacteria bacterium]|nr:phosphoribosylamine--glycine ligase [Alphaproteobacteria bacterium]